MPSGYRNRYLIRRRVRIGVALLAAFAVVALIANAAVRHAERHNRQAGQVVGYAPPTAKPGLTVAFLGDSYTGGSDMGGRDQKGWPRILAKRFGFYPVVNAVGGSGYVVGGPAGKPFGVRVSGVLSLSPNVIIVAGGLNDNTTPAAAVRAAATDVLTRLRVGDPTATIVVVGPFWPRDNPPPGALAVRAVLHTLAVKLRDQWIDPIGLFTGKWHALIGSDGTHPLDAGHRRIADVLGADLVRLGVLRSG